MTRRTPYLKLSHSWGLSQLMPVNVVGQTVINDISYFCKYHPRHFWPWYWSNAITYENIIIYDTFGHPYNITHRLKTVGGDYRAIGSGFTNEVLYPER